MIRRLGILLLATCLVLPNTSAAKAPDDAEPEVEYFFSTREQVTIGVMGLESGGGISQKQVDIIADIIAEHVSKLGDVRVVSRADIISMLNLEKQKRLAGCTDKECFSEIAGALGMPWMVTGNVSILGESIILNLKLIDVRNAYVAGRATRRIKGDLDELLDELPEATEELFEKVSDRLGLNVERRVTIAARHSQPIAESPSAVTVITREQIENTHCTDVICLLRQVPEVDVRRIAPAYAAVGARALTDNFGNRVLFVVDGREVIYESLGYVPWGALPIHLEDIERIEVIRGPGSALYGANAHSMVVSVATRKAAGSSVETFIGGGEHGRTSIHIRLYQHFGDWKLRLSGGIDTANNWRILDQSEREIGRLSLHLEHEEGSSTSQIRLDLEAPNALFHSGLGPVKAKESYLGYIFLSHQTDILRTQLTLHLMDQDWCADIPLYWGETKLGDFLEVYNYFTSYTDAEVQVTLSPFHGNLLISGGNYRWFYFLSDDNELSDIHQHRVGIYIHDEQRLFESLLVTAGVRFDYNTITPYAISPRLAGVWQLSEDNSIRMAFGQAFRKPSFYETSTHIIGIEGTAAFPELGEFFKKNVGNDKLGNEKTTTLEAGHRIKFLDKRLTVETDVFYTQFRNTIGFYLNMKNDEFGLPDLNSSEIRWQNTGREADSVGGSISLTYRVKPWRFNANYTFRHSWYISTPTEGLTVGEGSKGDRVPWEPTHLVNFSFHHVPERGLRLGMSLHGHSSTDFNLRKDGSIFGKNILVHSPPAYFISGFLAWRFELGSRWAEIGIRAFNILNAGFRDLPAVTRPDGVEQGGELLGRRIFLFMRGSM